MMNSTTVQIKRSRSPFLVFVAAMIAVLVGVPLVTLPFNRHVAQQKKTEEAITQPIYQELARATSLLQTGDTKTAGKILDEQRMVPLSVVAGGYAAGLMSADSPTTLLIRLGHTIRACATKEAKSGNREQALIWVARLHTLAEQSLRTKTPNYEALQIAYFMETLANRTEIGFWQEWGNAKRAERVRAKNARTVAVWNKRILPSIKARNEQNYRELVLHNRDLDETTQNIALHEKDHAYLLINELSAVVLS